MRNRLPRTSEKERSALKSRVIELIKQRQSDMDHDCKVLREKYSNIRKIIKLEYNPNNYFEELGIHKVLPFFHNAVSKTREQFHVKNKKYKLLIKKLGL